MQETLKIQIKKLKEEAVIPSYALTNDAGLDLTATSKELDEWGNITFGTGLAVNIPEGYVGLIFPRSSVARNSVLLSNSVGVIDSGYTGEITFKFKPSLTYPTRKTKPSAYEVGERVGQLIVIPFPKVEFEEVSSFPDTERGNGSYGSTGV